MSYLQRAKTISVSAGNSLMTSLKSSKRVTTEPDPFEGIELTSTSAPPPEKPKNQNLNINDETTTPQNTNTSLDMDKKIESFKIMGNNFAVMAKNAVERTATAASATYKAAQKTADIMATRAAESTKNAVNVTVDATKSAAERFDSWLAEDNEEGALPVAPKPAAVVVIAEVKNPAMFSIPIENTLLDSNGSKISDIPLVITEVISYLLDIDGYMEEGIFRLSGSMQSMNENKRKYNLREKVDYSTIVDPHLPACLLKLFLRELPEPLFTNQLMPAFYKVSTLPQSERVSTIVQLMNNQLPKLNSRILQEIYALLGVVVEHKSVNKMTVTNLGIIFLPAFGISSAELFELILVNQALIWNGPTIVSQHPKYPFKSSSANTPSKGGPVSNSPDISKNIPKDIPKNISKDINNIPIVSTTPPLDFPPPPIVKNTPPLDFPPPPSVLNTPPLDFPPPPSVSKTPPPDFPPPPIVSKTPPPDFPPPPSVKNTPPPSVSKTPPPDFPPPPIVSRTPPSDFPPPPIVSKTPPPDYPPPPSVKNTPPPSVLGDPFNPFPVINSQNSFNSDRPLPPPRKYSLPVRANHDAPQPSPVVSSAAVPIGTSSGSVRKLPAVPGNTRL